MSLPVQLPSLTSVESKGKPNWLSAVTASETYIRPASVGSNLSKASRCSGMDVTGVFYSVSKFNKIAIQGTPQMAVEKEAICLSRVYSYYYKYNLPLFYV